jgi:predicted AlkP superfamily pyrophosphatase or phosphodiesterase
LLNRSGGRRKFSQDSVRVGAIAFALLALLFPNALFAKAPRLVVLIVAEQFRADYLDLYADGFVQGGFRRLTENGAVFRRSRFPAATTFTAPAAATLATGALPSEHGIIADSWFDRSLLQTVRAAESAAGVYPERLLGSTFADELNLASRQRSRVVVVSGDPAPAAMLGGRRPRGVFWRGVEGAMVSGSYYAPSTPKWLDEYQSEHPLSPLGRRTWTAVGADAGAPPLRVLDTDQFLPLYRASPFAVEDLLGFAAAAIEGEQLGRRDYPDVLIVVLEESGRLALETGADSPLMRDMILRMDRALGQFFSKIEASVGMEDTVIAFTGLHGIPFQREDRERSGLAGGVVSGDEVARRADDALAREFGSGMDVWKYVYPFLYLSESARAGGLDRRRRILETAARAAMQTPGVAGWYSPETWSVTGAIEKACAAAFDPDRSGDLMLVYKPGWMEAFGDGRGVSSGSPYRYDTDVPLIFYGPRIRPGVRERIVDPRDVAPTLAALLNIASPSLSSGKPIPGLLMAPSTPPVGPPRPAVE